MYTSDEVITAPESSIETVNAILVILVAFLIVGTLEYDGVYKKISNFPSFPLVPALFTNSHAALFFILKVLVLLVSYLSKRLLFSLATTSEYRCSVYTYSFTFCPHIICSAFILWFCYISGYRWISFKLESHCTI